MRPKSIILLALALGSGLVAAIGINQVLANRNRVVVQSAETEPIFVAMVDIEYGDELGPQNVKLEEWPKDKIPEGALRKLEDVEGRKTRTKIYADEPILEFKLLSKDASEQGATALIPPGYRVVSVKVDAVSGGSALIMPNDRVDVLVHLLANPGRGISRTATKTILQDVRVFAVDSKYRVNPEDPEATGPAKTISLLVTPEQAELVTLASELGKIRLVMRSPEDDDLAKTDGAQVAELLGITEQADREAESLLPPDNQASSLVDLLDQQAATPDPEPVVQPVDATWTMVVLSGMDAQRVEFTEDGKTITTSSLTSPASGALNAGAGMLGDRQDADSDTDGQELDEPEDEEFTGDDGFNGDDD